MLASNTFTESMSELTAASSRLSPEKAAMLAGDIHFWIRSTRRPSSIRPVSGSCVSMRPEWLTRLSRSFSSNASAQRRAAGENSKFHWPGQIPDLYDPRLATTGNQGPAFGVEGHTGHNSGVSPQHGELCAGLRVPQADRAVAARRGDPASIGAKCHSGHDAGVTAEDKERPARRDVPDAGGLVAVTRRLPSGSKAISGPSSGKKRST